VAAADKKKLEDMLAKENHKTREVNTQCNTMSVGEADCLATIFVMNLYY
jgi:hypothetical protein